MTMWLNRESVGPADALVDHLRELALPADATVAAVAEAATADGILGASTWVMYAGHSITSLAVLSPTWTAPKFVVDSGLPLLAFPGAGLGDRSEDIGVFLLHVPHEDPWQVLADLGGEFDPGKPAQPGPDLWSLRVGQELTKLDRVAGFIEHPALAMARVVGTALVSTGLTLQDQDAGTKRTQQGGVGIFPYSSGPNGEPRVVVRWQPNGRIRDPFSTVYLQVQRTMDRMLADVLNTMGFQVSELWPGTPPGPMIVTGSSSFGL